MSLSLLSIPGRLRALAAARLSRLRAPGVPLLRRLHLRVGVSPDRLLVTGEFRGFGRSRGPCGTVPVEPQAGSPEWQAAIDALPAALAPAQGVAAGLTVVLSNAFVRYAVLPWSPALRTEAEWTEYGRRRLESVHGNAVADWEVRLGATAPKGPRIVAAVDRGLTEALADAASGAGVALESVQPHLVAAFNRSRGALHGATCWLLVEEPGRVVLALIHEGVWTSVRTRRVEPGWRHRLPEMIERESAALALDEPCRDIVLHAPEAFDVELPHDFRLRDATLGRGAAPTDQALAMALT